MVNLKNESLSVMNNDELDFEVHFDGEISLFKTIAGTWEAKDKDGKGLCSGPSKEHVLFWARNHLWGPLPGVETYVTKVKFGNKDL